MTAVKYPITDIQRFSTHDGDGIRTVVFVRGCPLRCFWCHNPETQSFAPQIYYDPTLCLCCGECARVCPATSHTVSQNTHYYDRTLCASCGSCAFVCPTLSLQTVSRLLSAEEIFDEVMRDAAFYPGGGGVTMSGGEPFMYPELCADIFRMAHGAGFSACAETCGYFDPACLYTIAPYTDTLLWDIKDTDRQRHKKNTGVYPDGIIKNLKLADSLNIKTVLRCIIVRGENDNKEHYGNICSLYKELKNCLHVELLPYHALGGGKARLLGGEDSGNAALIPHADDIRAALALLEGCRVPAKCFVRL